MIIDLQPRPRTRPRPLARAVLNDDAALYLAGYRSKVDAGVALMVESLRHMQERMLDLVWEPDEIGSPLHIASFGQVA